MDTSITASNDALCNALLKEPLWDVSKINTIIKLIESKKQDPTFINGHTNSFKLTPLMIASTEGLLPIVRHLIPLLLEHKCDINQTDKRGNTALMLAASEGHDKVVELLIHNGADINVANRNGNTALLLAVWYIYVPVVSMLVANGANKNHINEQGLTALTLAQNILSHGPIIDLLI
jgi:ankyrin repeat protein